MRALAAICPNHRRRPTGPFWAVFVSLRPLSLTQPNHARFGTDVRSSQNQWVPGHPEGHGFERAALRRSEQGSNSSVRYGSFAYSPSARRRSSNSSLSISPRAKRSLRISRDLQPFGDVARRCRDARLGEEEKDEHIWMALAAPSPGRPAQDVAHRQRTRPGARVDADRVALSRRELKLPPGGRAARRTP